MWKPAGHNSGGFPWRVGYAAPTGACPLLAPDIFPPGTTPAGFHGVLAMQRQGAPVRC